jgi:hypothetical protein
MIKKALELKIDMMIEEIGTDETCDDKFYSLEKLKVKYPVNWEFWKNFGSYTYNKCISLLGGIEPDKKLEINEIIWEWNHAILWNKFCGLLSASETNGILRRLRKVIDIERNCIAEKNYDRCSFQTDIVKEDFIINYLHLLSFAEIKEDLDAYHLEKSDIKNDKFKKITAELKRENPSRAHS